MTTLYRDPEGTTWGTDTGWSTDKAGPFTQPAPTASFGAGNIAELNGALITMSGNIDIGLGTIQNTDGGCLQYDTSGGVQSITANIVAVATNSKVVDMAVSADTTNALTINGDISGGTANGAQGVHVAGQKFVHNGIATGGAGTTAYAILAGTSTAGTKVLGSLRRGSGVVAFYSSGVTLSVTVLGSLTFRNGLTPLSAINFSHTPAAGSRIYYRDSSDVLTATWAPVTEIQADDASTLTGTTLDVDGTDTIVAFGASNGTAKSGAVYTAGGVARHATDVAEVTAKRGKIQNDGTTTILGVSGTLDIAADNPPRINVNMGLGL